MNILDENVIDSQRRLLTNWRVSVRQIGYEVGRKGVKDHEIVPLLHQLDQPTFFTRDDDFYERKLCHAGYCLVFLDAAKKKLLFLSVAFFNNRHSTRKPNEWERLFGLHM